MIHRPFYRPIYSPFRVRTVMHPADVRLVPGRYREGEEFRPPHGAFTIHPNAAFQFTLEKVSKKEWSTVPGATRANAVNCDAAARPCICSHLSPREGASRRKPCALLTSIYYHIYINKSIRLLHKICILFCCILHK